MHKKNIIDPQDISVVVQGAIDKNLTPQCLKSIRKHLPGAEIILSTWDGSDVTGLDYDKLVLNKDPGAYPNTTDGKRNYNLNRYLVSTQSGIKKASKKYVLKMRSDMLLTGANFLRYFNKFKHRDARYSLFKHKVLTSSLYTIEGEKGIKKERHKMHPTPYHISDWWHFGLADDIKLLFKCPIIKNFKKFAQYFKEPKYELSWLNHRLWRFPPEQYLGIELAKKKFSDLYFPDCLSYKNVDLKRSRNFIVDNFITLDYKQSQILLNKDYYLQMCKKYRKIPPHVFYTMFSFDRYKSFYYGLPNFRMFFKRLYYYYKNRNEL